MIVGLVAVVAVIEHGDVVVVVAVAVVVVAAAVGTVDMM